jgi:arylsulfatase
MKPKPNVVLVSLDAVRAETAYSPLFPAFDALTRAAARFTRAISVSPITPVSHGTILTGLLPRRHGIRHLLREQLAPNAPTLAATLGAAGYRTGAVVAAAPLNRWFGLSRGFDHYDDEVPATPDPSGKALKRADEVATRALAWARRGRRRPFFLFVHFFDAHWPYCAPGARLATRIATRHPYEEEIAFLQQEFGRLLAGLRELTEELVVVTLADHGEDLGGFALNDHVGSGSYPEEETHGCLLFDGTQHVPLWISADGVAPREVPWQVSLLDVTPTILDLVEVESPAVDGRSLRPLLDGSKHEHRLAYSETFHREERAQHDPSLGDLRPLKALRVDDAWKIVWEVGGERCDVYDLAADPRERTPAALETLPAELSRRVTELRREYDG